MRTKFDGGKQINRSQGGSWQGRCAGAGLRQNEGAAWGPVCWEKSVLTEPSDVFKRAADDVAKRVEMDRKRKASRDAKLQRKRARYNSVDNSLSSREAYSRYNKHRLTSLILQVFSLAAGMTGDQM